MPIDDAANINSTGILISSTNLNLIKLSDNQQSVSIGAGNRWDDVYEYLDGTVWAVPGARQSTVGVAGYLLGGGMSFYSYEYGFGSTNGNVRAFEVRYSTPLRLFPTNSTKVCSVRRQYSHSNCHQ